MNMDTFKITKEMIPMQPMIYARRVGEYGPENGALMQRFKEWIGQHGYMTKEAVILGIAQDDARVTPPENCKYDVCLLGQYETDVDWIVQGTLGQGDYVVIELPHTEQAVSFLWKEGIPYLIQKGYQLDFKRPVIERYKKSLVDQHLCEMLFPVK